ncbi:MAG: hypothetical protein IIB60_03690, partial [Planctomycetes bacterium]|nr:hypothetical protein [Planctomycetota bacterium]
MFERRLKLLLVAAGLVALVIVGRLIELQVVHAGYYRKRAERSMRLRPRPLPFIRGAIVDRNGEVLVSDQACWDLTLDFRIIAAERTGRAGGHDAKGKAALKVAVRRWGLAKRYAHARNDQEVEQAFRREVSAMWADIARLTAEVDPLSIPELRDRAARIYGGIMRIRRIVAHRRGFDSPIAEETAAHSILTRLDANRQIAARELLAPYP